MVNDSQFVVARSQDAAEQPTPNQRGEHVIYASAQVIGVIVDFGVGKIGDLHFLQWLNSSGIAISNHFKYIANEFPVTMIFIGVGLAARGLFSEGSDYQDAVLAQTGRRATALDMEPFTVNTECGRQQWRQLLLAIEQRVVLADKHPGMIADDLCDYLYARSTGHIGSLMTLINRGCQRAVRSGEEKLTTELLDKIKIDTASEKARQELELAINTGKIRVRRKAG